MAIFYLILSHYPLSWH